LRACHGGSLALALALIACTQEVPQAKPAQTEIRVGNSRAFVVPAPRAQASPQDKAQASPPSTRVALEGPTLTIEARTDGNDEERGTLSALRQPAGVHELESLRGLVAIDGVLIEPAVQRVQITKLGGRPAIAIDAIAESRVSSATGATDASDLVTRLSIRRVLRLTDAPGALRISTGVRVDAGPLPSELRVIERVAWGGGLPIAPGSGELRAELPVDAEWLGRATDHRALVIAALEGEAHLVGRNFDHGRSDLLRFTDVWLPTRITSAGRFASDAILSASHAGLAGAVRQLGWARGKPFTEAIAMLSTRPPEALVQVIDGSSHQPVISGVPDDALRVILPLPERFVGRPLVVGASARNVEASPWLPLAGPPYQPVMLAITATSMLEVRVRHAVTGEALPARIRVLPRRNTAQPSFGPDWQAKGALDTIVSASGAAAIRIAAGYYRVIVTHGPEWSVADENIEVGIGETKTLSVALERAIDPGPWVPCELHVHQAPSPDSEVSLEDRVASLVAEGIAFAVPTDHNHVTDFEPAIRAQPLWGLGSVPGVEVTTADPNFGHFNAYPFPIDLSRPGQGAPEYAGRAPAELFAELHAVSPDVVVQVNHPRIEGGIGYFDVAEYDSKLDRGGELWSADFDALEVWNGFDLARWPNVEKVFADWLALNAHGHRIVATGSSDSHTIRSEGAGYPRTYIRAPLAGVGHGVELIRALRKGQAFVTSGPFLNVQIEGRGLGDAVELLAPQIELEIFVQTPAWMPLSQLRVYVGEKLVRSGALGPPSSSTSVSRRYTRKLRLVIDKPGPLVVAVEGEASLEPIVARRGVRPFAFTNPIWLVRPGEKPPEPLPVTLVEAAPPANLVDASMAPDTSLPAAHSHEGPGGAHPHVHSRDAAPGDAQPPASP
jgi:hypothetical protein